MPWQVLPASTQILAVHAALLDTNQIILIGGDQHDADLNDAGDFRHTRLFDCSSLTIAGVGSPPFDAFCCGQALLIDGRLLIAGGTDDFPPGTGHHAPHFPGLRDTAIYNPRSGAWTSVAPMSPEPGRTSGGGRWYPSLITLADGKVLTVAGHPREDDSRHDNDSPEVYSPSPRNAGTWRLISGPDPGHSYTYYPRAHVLPDENVLFASPVGGRTQRLRSEPYAWADLGAEVAGGYGGLDVSSVLLPLLPEHGYRARVLFVGRQQPRIFDAGAPASGWQATAARALAGAPVRNHANAVLLADGKVLVCGGVQDPGNDATAVRQAEIFDPYANSWSVGDTASVVRNYHSVALLMPDGRVFTAGGNRGAQQSFPAPGVDTRELRIELYSPPYVAASRPAIRWAPRAVGWAENFHVQTTQEGRIRRVAMIRAGSATHAWNGDQRFVGCTFSRQGDWLHVKAPPNPGVAPPGPYLLVTVNDAGAPSPGRFVRVSPKARGSGSLVQGNFGTKGNFELVAPRRGGGMNFWWRNNDAAGLPWSAPSAIAAGTGPVADIPSLLQSNFGRPGNLEVAARIGDRLAFYWRGAVWNGPTTFGTPGVSGNPAMIQGTFGGRGNFELVVPVAAGGIAHYWRNNDAPGLPWSSGGVFGQASGRVDAVALIQSNFGDPGNLEVIARYGTRLALWWRESGPPWRWSGPIFFFDGATGVPSLVQSRFGARGNFELVTPLAAGGAAHLWRNNDAASLPWSGPSVAIGPGSRYVAASLVESNFGVPGNGGNLELILRAEDGRNLHFWRVDGPPWNWSGATATLTA
jgi:hypothetical protein